MLNLKNLHENRPIAVIGGGPTREADYTRIEYPRRLIQVGCNHHRVFNIVPDYVVHMDYPGHVPALSRYLRSLPKSTKIGAIRPPADFIFDKGTRALIGSGNVGIVAAWFALRITTGPVYLCGFDCYQGVLKEHAREPLIRKWDEFLSPSRVKITPEFNRELKYAS